MTPEEWATDLVCGHGPRIQDGWGESFARRIASALRKARAEALEEAAKVADDADLTQIYKIPGALAPNVREYIADRIRKLKS